VVVPRPLWDAVGGFDERFEGWGGEDDAFHAACRALCGTERLRGVAWHLWHEESPWRDHRSALYVQAYHLANRYTHTREAKAMRALLGEPRTPEQTVLLCLTTGERETLAETLASAQENLDGPIGRRLLCVDGASKERCAELQREHPHWDVVRMPGRRGYTRAVCEAREHAIGSGQPWVFWLEDDFTFTEPVDIAQMQAVMEANPQLAQLALKRQAWYPHEVEAGGVIEAKPEAFTQRGGYVEHADYWTMNPMLVRRAFLAANRWPQSPGSERRFGERVLANGTRAGILGAIEDPPRVIHTGAERAGRGY
jgi:hypothetical protein